MFGENILFVVTGCVCIRVYKLSAFNRLTTCTTHNMICFQHTSSCGIFFMRIDCFNSITMVTGNLRFDIGWA